MSDGFKPITQAEQREEQRQRKLQQEREKVYKLEQQRKIEQQKQQEYNAQLRIVQEQRSARCVLQEKVIGYEGSDRHQYDCCFAQAVEDVLNGDHSIKTVECVLTSESQFILNDLQLDYANFVQCSGNTV